MGILNVEIKAKSDNHSEIKELITSINSIFKGLDNQIDTYFKVTLGCLKLREGSIDNNLIHYVRENKAGPKQPEISLFKSNSESTLKEILTNAIGVLTVVDKQRENLFH